MIERPTDPKYDDDPRMVAYASERGLFYSRVSMPRKSTQLLRHGNLQLTWDAMRGVLPGGLEGTLMHWEWGNVGDMEQFTVALFEVPAGERVAARLVCHDRGLSKASRANPDAGSEVIRLDDKAERLESEAFVRRFTLATDADTDQNKVWQLFEPAFIDWLVDGAPEGLSFEVQDGSVCVFVKSMLTDPAELDALSAAASKIAARVAAEGQGGEGLAPRVAVPVAPGSRDDILERELAEAKFDEPPKDVKHAANAFRAGPLRTDRSWRLGEEAFFREYAKTLGLRPLDTSAFKAAHLDLGYPGRLAHVAGGVINWLDQPGYLFFSDLEDGDSNGWASIAVERAPGASPMALGGISDAARKRGCHLFYDATTTSLCQDGGGTRNRTKKELDDFMEFAKAELPALVGIAGV